MKMSSISGWRDVFAFTLKQTLKSKAFIIGFIIFVTFSILLIPIMNLVIGDNVEEEGLIKIQTVYVYNETEITDIDFTKVSNLEIAVNDLKFITENKEYDDVLEQIEKDDEPAVTLKITKDEGMYFLHFTKASSGIVKNTELELLGNAVMESFEQIIIDNVDISDEQLEVIKSEVGTRVYTVDSKGKEIILEDTSISYNDYWLLYGILFIILMVNMTASTKIATSIVTEKSSKVIEHLLTSIKPLAIIIGKILAMLSAVLIQFVFIIILLFISNSITSHYINPGRENILKDYINPDVINNFGIDKIIICLLIIALGFIFYATLAGLAGATTSRVEEVSESLTMFTFTSLIGAYVGMGAAGTLMGTGENAFVYFALIFPLSSPFIMPGAVILGKTSVLLVISSIIVQIISIVLLFRFVARVYETLILHNGNRIAMKELFKIAKTVKEGSVNEK
ncbi:UNVERIFIED_CONTAM: ABC-2 type transport system permease protein [Acetivibrio alkalicellulosi]